MTGLRSSEIDSAWASELGELLERPVGTVDEPSIFGVSFRSAVEGLHSSDEPPSGNSCCKLLASD